MARIVIINNTSIYVLRFRRQLIAELVRLGHEVTLLAPRDRAWPQLAELGITVVPLPLAQHGTNPIREARTLAFLIRELRSRRPDHVISFTVKPTIYGSIAAKLAGVSRIFSVFTGLGFYFTDPDAVDGRAGKLIRALLRVALPLNARVIFQNSDDRQAILRLGLVPPEKTTIVAGSGVDVRHFAPSAGKVDRGSFLLIGRMLKEKGVREFVEAADSLRGRYPEARFILLGGIDGSSSAITRAEIDAWTQRGVIEYRGEVSDVREHIAKAEVIVLPSYREGLPRSVLEAMAMAKPIVTTDAPGCRETVAEGCNGFLVAPRDSLGLAKAMEKFLSEPGLSDRLGRASREIVERKFDVLAINRAFLEAFQIETPQMGDDER